MLTIKHAFNSKIQSVTLVHALRSHFYSLWYPIICFPGAWWSENERSMNSSLVSQNSVQSGVCECVCRESSQREERMLTNKMQTPLSLSIYIYIYCTLHTLVGRLDLMGQSSELGWAHKKSSNNICPIPLWTTMQK